MVATRMDTRVEQLEKAVNEIQSMRAHVTELQRNGQENREQMAAMQTSLV